MSDNQVCAKHSSVLTRLLLYDGLSVLVSLVANVFTRYVLKRKDKKSLPGHFPMNKLFISTCGTIFGHILVAYLSAQVVSSRPPPGYLAPGPGEGILAWATRPRASFAVFFVNGIFVFWDLRRAEKERKAYLDECIREVHRADSLYYSHSFTEHEEIRQKAIESVPRPPAAPRNCFLHTCVGTFLAEAHVCLVGVPLWYNFTGWPSDNSYSSTSNRPDGDQPCDLYLVGAARIVNGSGEFEFPTCTVATNRSIIVAKVGLTYCTIVFAALLVLPVWFLSSRRCCVSTSLGGLFKWMMVSWVFATGIFVFSFMMWKAFLDGTSDDEYCLVGAKKLDVIYVLWALVLALWRQVV